MFLNLENDNGFIMKLKKNNPIYDPSKEESEENPRLLSLTDRQSINDEFRKTFQKIYSKLEVEDNSGAIQEFLDIGGDTKPSEYLKSEAFSNEESN